MEQVKLKIDGQETQVPKGTLIIEAAKGLGIDIPHFCYHPKLSIAGNCRMCVVEIEGLPKLQISCNTPVTDGMVVFTNTEKVKKARQAVMEFLLINHPLDCPICDQAGECKLQDYYMEHDMAPSRFKEEKVFKGKVIDLGPIVLDQERCVLCTRCMRFLREVAKRDELGIYDRGDHSFVGVVGDKDRLLSKYTGCLDDVCPVGALTTKDFRFKCRVWYLNQSPSVCPNCSTGCNTTIWSRDGIIYRLSPRENEDVNQCWMCDDGRYGYSNVSEGRVRTPLARKGSGFVEISWDEALDKIREPIRRAKSEQILGIGSAWATNEDNYLFGRLLNEVIGSKNIRLFKYPDGEADDFLIQSDKNPNTKGAVEILSSFAKSKDDLFLANLKDAQVVYLLEADLVGTGAIDQKDLDEKDFVIVQSANFTKTCDVADVVLPAATYAETEGTFTNFKGLLQKIEPAFAPMYESKPNWKILCDVAGALGCQFNYEGPGEILEELKGKIKL